MAFLLGSSTLGVDALGAVGAPLCALDDLVLSQNLVWIDRNGWNPVSQSATPTVTGALVIEPGKLTEGRPITLSRDWLPPETVEALRLLADTPDYHGLLTLPDGQQFTVIWRHQDGAMQADPLFDAANGADISLYSVTLRFMEIAL